MSTSDDLLADYGDIRRQSIRSAIITGIGLSFLFGSLVWGYIQLTSLEKASEADQRVIAALNEKLSTSPASEAAQQKIAELEDRSALLKKNLDSTTDQLNEAKDKVAALAAQLKASNYGGSVKEPFDGIYSVVTVYPWRWPSAGLNRCPEATAVGPLTISNRHAEARWGDSILSGNINPGGYLVMDSVPELGQLRGQVADGFVRGYFRGTHCNFDVEWRRSG